jgi:hypothetical protein
MRSAHSQITHDRNAGRVGDQTHHCPSAGGSRPPATVCKRRGDNGGSTIEFRLYLPRTAWHFTFARTRATPVKIRGIAQTDDDLDQIAAPSAS